MLLKLSSNNKINDGTNTISREFHHEENDQNFKEQIPG